MKTDDGDEHELEVILQPGELLLYESARLPHGRTSFLRWVLSSFSIPSYSYSYIAHCCAIFLCHLVSEIYDHHRNPNNNDRDHLDGQLTRLDLTIFQGQELYQSLCSFSSSQRWVEIISNNIHVKLSHLKPDLQTPQKWIYNKWKRRVLRLNCSHSIRLAQRRLEANSCRSHFQLTLFWLSRFVLCVNVWARNCASVKRMTSIIFGEMSWCF